MSLQAEAETALFRRRNRQFALAATLAIVVIGVIVTLTLVVVLLRAQVMRAERLERIALGWSPAACYVWALWTLHGMFKAMARDGLSFQPQVIAALGRVGWALGWGAALTLIEAPLMAWLIHGPGPGSFAALNVPAMTLGVTGLALIALARMLARGARLEAEAARLKAVLDDFI
jgi:hypothetical protein